MGARDWLSSGDPRKGAVPSNPLPLVPDSTPATQPLPPMASAPEAWLEDTTGAITRLAATCLIGRSSKSQLRVADDQVSRRHALIHAQTGGYHLVDLGSSNGTLLNGRRIHAPELLQDGDRIFIGNAHFIFRHPAAPRGDASGASAAHDLDSAATLQAREAEMWLLVADIEKFTALCQETEPSLVARIVGSWLLNCKQIVENRQGIINKYLGDGFFAYWRHGPGAPEAVIECLRDLQKIQALQNPRFRTVLHLGRVTLGGASIAGEESLLGPAVNFAFRLEKVASQLGELSVLSPEAHRMLPGLGPVIRPLGPQSVPGSDRPVILYSMTLAG
jgi:adenylate cyclase